MPIGIIVNSLSVFFGAVVGTAVGHRLSTNFKESINMVLGACAMTMGIPSICLMENMPAVIFSVLVGTAIGLAMHVGDMISAGGAALQRVISRAFPAGRDDIAKEEFDASLLTIVVLFCASSTGIYGSLVSGMTGEHTILISKAVLDFFTAMVFACLLGPVVAIVALPQFVVFMLFFLLAGIIYPLTTASMINDFKACGGVLMLATGFRMLKLRMFPIADMIPAMLLVMPCSYLWQTYIFPLL